MSLEALLVLFTAYGTGTLLSRGTWSGSLVPLSGYLPIYLIGLVGFVVFFVLEQRNPPRPRLRFFVVLVVLLSIILLVANRQIQARQSTTVTTFPNDSLVQSVAAAEGLLQGQNPYAMDFGQTAFRIFPSAWGGSPDFNVARLHYIYPPLEFLVFVPQVVFSRLAHLTIDYQSFYLVLFLLIVWLLCRLTPSWQKRTLILIFTLGNPWLWVNVLIGYNDTLVALLLLSVLMAWKGKRFLLSGVLLGLALSAKQTTWVLLPLWAYWIWRQHHLKLVQWVDIKKAAVSAVLVCAVIYLPFLLWNAPAMYDDMFRYLSGAIPGSVPLAGFTFAQYLAVFHIVSGSWATTSILPLTLLATALISWWAIRRVRKNNELKNLFGLSAVVMLVVILFNRLGADNYLIPVFVLAIAAHIIEPSSSASHV